MWPTGSCMIWPLLAPQISYHSPHWCPQSTPPRYTWAPIPLFPSQLTYMFSTSLCTCTCCPPRLWNAQWLPSSHHLDLTSLEMSFYCTQAETSPPVTELQFIVFPALTVGRNNSVDDRFLLEPNLAATGLGRTGYLYSLAPKTVAAT